MSGRPDWSSILPAVDRLLPGDIAFEAEVVADLDQFGAYIRDGFDEFGVAVTDEEQLFVVFVTFEIVARQVLAAITQGELSPAGGRVMLAALRGLIAVLRPHIPAEATR